MRNLIIRFFLAIALVGTRKRAKKTRGASYAGTSPRILLTATFYSEQWIKSQLIPLVESGEFESIWFVASTPVPDIRGVSVIYAPHWLHRVAGAVGGRLLTFIWIGLRYRPEIIAGFHLLLNGLVAQLVARLARRQSVYVCVGGPTEVIGGGYATENRIFGKLEGPDSKIEIQLLRAVNAFDVVVVRGESAKSYFRDKDIGAPIYAITAGVDSDEFQPSDDEKYFDLIFLARLSSVKRVSIFLEIVHRIKTTHRPKVRAGIIGDGPDRILAEKLIDEYSLDDSVQMFGQRSDISRILNSAKVFVLTSRSEGMSQAMVQAMLCGLPAVVADVGSLRDIVTNGESGYLVEDHGSAAQYVLPIMTLLDDESECRRAGAAARQAAMHCSVKRVAQKWRELVRTVR